MKFNGKLSEIVAFLVIIVGCTSAFCENQIGLFAEISTVGLRVGANMDMWDAYGIVNSDFFGSENEHTEKSGDTIVLKNSYSQASSNIEIGIGFDRFWAYDPLRIGGRMEMVYEYPYSTNDRQFKYLSQQAFSNRIALATCYKIESIVIGTSIGPKITQKFWHSKYEQNDLNNKTLLLENKSSSTNVKIVGELFLRVIF